MQNNECCAVKPAKKDAKVFLKEILEQLTPKDEKDEETEFYQNEIRRVKKQINEYLQ